jgi:hypothetical protein
MSKFRTAVSALSIMLGALSLALWALSLLALSIVEDGTVFANVARGSYDNPEFKAAVTDEAQRGVRVYFERQGVDLEALRLDGAMDALVANAVESDAFPALVESQVESAREQFLLQLREPDRPPGPLVIMVDLSGVINDQFDSSPIIGAALPAVVIPPVAVEAVDAEAFEDARVSYRVVDFARTWLLWAGLALVAIGLAASPRRRWFATKFLLALGILALGAWAIMTFAEPATVAAWTPGGQDGTAGSVVAEVMTSETFAQIAQRVLWLAVGVLLAAGIAGAMAFRGAQRARRGLAIGGASPVGLIERGPTPPAGGDFQPTWGSETTPRDDRRSDL